VKFGDAFLCTWNQKVLDQTVKVVVIVEKGRRPSDVARNLRIFLNRIHAELLASEYGLTAIEAGLRTSRTRNDVSEAIRKLHGHERKIKGLITRVGRSISALSNRRNTQAPPSVYSVLELIWDWRVDVVMDRCELIREKAARRDRELTSWRFGTLLRRSIFPIDVSRQLSIFISYRRDDTRDLAGRIGDFLERSELRPRVFRDLGSIEPGSNWRSEIERGIKEAHLVLPIFGPNWIGRSQTGRRRIDDQDDIVRLEIEYALNMQKEIVPIVVQGTPFPPPSLPDSLRALFAIQTFLLDPESGFDQSMRILLSRLQRFRPRYMNLAARDAAS
jgi:hypothetical protein